MADQFEKLALDRLEEIGSQLAALVSAMEGGKANEDAVLEIGSALVDLVGIAEDLKSGPLQGAIAGIAAGLSGMARAIEKQAAGSAQIADAVYRGISAIKPAPATVIYKGSKAWAFDVEYNGGNVSRIVGREMEAGQ